MKPDQVKLTPDVGLLMVLMRLRLNLRVEDLGSAFHCPLYLESFTSGWKWCLNIWNIWPAQEAAFHNMPQILKDLYPCTRCIIDCSEIFIEHPQAYQTRAKTYSNYKKHNTVKFLIAVTPCGAFQSAGEEERQTNVSPITVDFYSYCKLEMWS